MPYIWPDDRDHVHETYIFNDVIQLFPCINTDTGTWDKNYQTCYPITFHEYMNNPQPLTVQFKGIMLGATGNQQIITMSSFDKQWMVKIN